MACKDPIPVSIEYRRILFGAGTLIDPTPICKQIDDECCADEGDPTCCDGEFATNLAVTLSGPIDGACGDESVPFTLDWSATDERWYGEATNANLSYSFRVWFACVNGVYLGTVQILDPDGVLLEEGDLTLVPNADCTLLEDSFVPDEELAACVDPISVEIDHPCPEACVSNGQRVPCCPGGYVETLAADIDTVGAVTLVFDGDFGIWQGAVAVGDDTYILTLWCNADGTWTGWIDLYTDGELIDSGDNLLAPGPDCSTLVGSITVQGETLSVEIVHPCPPSPCGGTIESPCCVAGVPEALYLHTSGGQHIPLVWNGLTGALAAWSTGVVTITGCGTSEFTFACNGVDATGLTLSAGASIGVSCFWVLNALTQTAACDPFAYSVEGEPDPGCSCGSPLTFTVNGSAT